MPSEPKDTQKRDEVLKRMLNTPPKPLKESKKNKDSQKAEKD